MEIEVSLKVRSAIKAKLLELGVHVDDELPDYIMVLVANRRTKTQMESDLELFLSDNTIKFTTWLYHVLKKLEQVTLNANNPTGSELAHPPATNAPEPSSLTSSSEKTIVKVQASEHDKTKAGKEVKSSHKNHSKCSSNPTKVVTKAKVSTTKNTGTKGSDKKVSKFKEKSSKSTTEKSSEKAVLSKSNSEKPSYSKSSHKSASKNSQKTSSPQKTSSSDIVSTTEGRAVKKSTEKQTNSTLQKSSDKLTEPKVQFRIKNNLVKKSEYDKKLEEAEERKVESTSKINIDEPSDCKAVPTSTTANEQQNPDSSSMQEDILSLADEEGDFCVIGGAPGEVSTSKSKKEAKAKSRSSDHDEEDVEKLRAIALETTSPNNRRKLESKNVSALRGIVMNNEKENTTKRKSENESDRDHSRNKSRNDRPNHRGHESPPQKRLCSVVTPIITAKRPPSQEYDPAEPNLHKVSSVVCATSSQRPKRNTSNMNTNLIFKAMKEVEIENIKRPTASKSKEREDPGRVRRHRERDEKDGSWGQTRSRSRDKVSRDPDRVDRKRDTRISESERSYRRTRDHDRSRSPVQLFTKKKGNIKDRLGERHISRDIEFFNPPLARDEELDMGYMDEEEIRAMEKDLNIVINVPNVRAQDTDDERNITRGKEPEKVAEKPEIELLEEMSPLREPDSVTTCKDKGFVPPNRISIRVMNSSDDDESGEESGGDSEEKKQDAEEEPDEDSEDELEVTVNDEKDIDDLMPPPPASKSEKDQDGKDKKPAPVDRLADLRAKLAAIKQTNTSSYLPLGCIKPQLPTISTSKPITTTSYFGSSISSVASSLGPPTPTTCKFWPTCSFGGNCKFIHPKCKYGESCSKRPACPYKHDAEGQVAPPFKKPFLPTSNHTAPPNKKPCLFFPNCLSMDCTFYHPKPCRYGIGCTDSNCVHFHPGDGSIGEQKKGKLPAMHQFKWSK